jgi:hypothetical protein
VGSTGQRERARVREERRRQDWPTGQREGESVRAGARAGPAWANWAELAFSIFREFLIPFLFIFSRVFNSNSN